MGATILCATSSLGWHGMGFKVNPLRHGVKIDLINSICPSIHTASDSISGSVVFHVCVNVYSIFSPVCEPPDSRYISPLSVVMVCQCWGETGIWHHAIISSRGIVSLPLPLSHWSGTYVSYSLYHKVHWWDVKRYPNKHIQWSIPVFAKVHTSAEVISTQLSTDGDGSWEIVTSQDQKFTAQFVINCAGLYGDHVDRLAGYSSFR